MRSRLAVAVLMVSLAGLRPVQGADSFKVIVNAKAPGHAISRETLSQVYLGRVERWSDGRLIAAVDLSSTSPVRAAFSQTVLGMTVLGVKQYWTRTISSGHFPPISRSTDEDVVAFVASRSGGSGYVSAEVVLPDTVRLVSVQ